MEQEKRYYVALGYGGKLEAAARFEWNFRVRAGAEQADDEAGKEAFIRDFVTHGVEGQPYVILLEEGNEPLLHLFVACGKQALNQDPDLSVFLVIEDAEDPERQFRLYLQPDPSEELIADYEVMVDVQGIPQEVLLWLQERFGVRFYRREEEYKMAFSLDELPVLN
jgi:hypothetical protein